jgi:hypothetical protein
MAQDGMNSCGGEASRVLTGFTTGAAARPAGAGLVVVVDLLP